MRLIDGDALIAKYGDWYTEEGAEEGYIGTIKGIVDSMPTIEPEPKWIPCSDVPDTDRNVFIARGEQGNMTVCIGHYSNEYKQWYEDRNWFGMLLYDGLYWCEMPPLPEPYREEGAER